MSWQFSGIGRVSSIKELPESKDAMGHIERSIEFQFHRDPTDQKHRCIFEKATAWNAEADKIRKMKEGDKAAIIGYMERWAFIGHPHPDNPNGKRTTIQQPGLPNGVLEPHKLPEDPGWHPNWVVFETHQLIATKVVPEVLIANTARNALSQYTDQKPFDYNDPWWIIYSEWYRDQMDWTCEECQTLLRADTRYLHTHHLRGAEHNDLEDLKALCIACHSDQKGSNHNQLKNQQEYHDFLQKYGKHQRGRQNGKTM